MKLETWGFLGDDGRKIYEQNLTYVGCLAVDLVDRARYAEEDFAGL